MSSANPSIDKSSVDAINDAAGYCRTLWAAFIGYAATLFIPVSGTTHENLLLETPVKMPLFDIGVPLPLFYIIAPLLLVLFHLNLLMKMHDLRVRVRALTDTLTNDEMRDLLRRQVTAFDYALLVGRLISNRAERLLLSIVTDVTVFIMPVALLLFIQLRFLPDHNLAMTWFHRALVIVDLGLIFYIQHWLGTDGEKTLGSFVLFLLPDLKKLATLTKAAVRARGGDSLLKLAATAFYPRGWLAFLAVLASIFVLTIPSEIPDFWSTDEDGANWLTRTFGIERNLVINDDAFRTRDVPPEILAVYENQSFQNGKIGEAPPRPDPIALARRRFGITISLHDRDISYAQLPPQMFNYDPDFRNAILVGARLADFSLIPNATAIRFDEADLRGVVWRRNANLQRTSFTEADLRRASFESADLRRANFSDADARGINLTGSNLQLAALNDASLQGALFSEAHMELISLSDEELEGADFSGAHLAGANLSCAHLDGANFEEADLQGVDFTGTRLRGANFVGAKLRGAKFGRSDDCLSPDAESSSQLTDVTLAQFKDIDLETPYDFTELRAEIEKSAPANALAGAILPPAGRRRQDLLRQDLLKRIENIEMPIASAEILPSEVTGENTFVDQSGAQLFDGSKIKTRNPPSYVSLLSHYFVSLICYAGDGTEKNSDKASARFIAERIIDARINSFDDNPFTLAFAKEILGAGAVNICARRNVDADTLNDLREMTTAKD